MVSHQEYFKQKNKLKFTSVKKLQKLQIVTKLGEKVTKLLLLLLLLLLYWPLNGGADPFKVIINLFKGCKRM